MDRANLSDLAGSCEYLTIDKLCSAISESEKAKSNRQSKCLMPEKTVCCYICQSRTQCPIKCIYLGNTEKQYPPTESEKPTEPRTPKTTDPETTPIKSTQELCSSCYQEMSQTITRLEIGNWRGPHPQLSNNIEGKKEFLDVRIYLCTQCGKIEFKLDEKQKRGE